MIYFGVQYVGGNGMAYIPNEQNSTREARIACDMHFAVASKCFRREFLKEKNIQFINGIYYEDMVYSIKASIFAENIKYGNFPIYYYYRNRQGSIMTTPSIKRCSDMYRVLEELMKLYEINDGDIIIDGISTKKLTRDNIHKLFIMVLQDTWLFEGTIRDNIKFNKENVTDEEIWNALRTVGVDHFVKTLPGGLDYVLTESDSISQGQKQLLTIARGMIEDAPFLILDEATSNVDTRTEELVQKAMDKLTKGHTSFIIAHRLSTIKNADLILVMDHGNIIEMGNHNELMKQKGFYCDLYNSQFTK